MTIGAIDGNIIAAIITTQTPMKNPSAPGSVPGPASMPLHLLAGDDPGHAGEQRRAVRSARAGSGPEGRGAGVSTPIPSPLRDGQRPTSVQAAQANSEAENPALASYWMPKALMLRTRGARDGELGAGRMEDAGDLHRFAGLDTEGNDVLDLEVDLVADPDRMGEAILTNLDRQPLEGRDSRRPAVRGPPSDPRAPPRTRCRASRPARRRHPRR